jgi:hypothetical protein
LSGGLKLKTTVPLAPGQPGGFDHGDVDRLTGRVVAHTAFGSIEVIDGESLKLAGRIDGCPEGSGVLCAAEARLVFAAARGAGKVLVIDPDRLAVVREIAVGPRPNALAWDGSRAHLLVADVDPTDQSARLIDVSSARSSPRRRYRGGHAGACTSRSRIAIWSISATPRLLPYPQARRRRSRRCGR